MAQHNGQAYQLDKAKQGDEVALAAIIAVKMPLIRHFAAEATGPGLDFDDAVQEGLIGLFHAIESYTEGGGAAFDTYATTCIRNAVATARRAAGRKKHAPLNQSVPLEAQQSIPGPEEIAIETESIAAVLRRARTRLSPFEKQVLGLYLEGYAYREIAAKLGKEAKSIDNAMLRIRRKLK